MSNCCKARVQKGQARYQLPDHARPPAPGGSLASRTAYLLKQCLESLLRARMRRVDARALLAVFPHHWEDGAPVCLVYHTDADGDFGAFRMVLQGDGQPALQCTACDAVVGGVGGAESHVFTGKPTNNAKKYLYVYSVQLSLAALTDRINEGLLQAHDLVYRAQQQQQQQQVVEVVVPRAPPQLMGGVSSLSPYAAAANPALPAAAGSGAMQVKAADGAAAGNAAAVQEDAAEALMLLGMAAGRAFVGNADGMEAVGAADGDFAAEDAAGQAAAGEDLGQPQGQHVRAARIPLQQLDQTEEQGGSQQQANEPHQQQQQQQQQQAPGSQQQWYQQQVKEEPKVEPRQQQQQQASAPTATPAVTSGTTAAVSTGAGHEAALQAAASAAASKPLVEAAAAAVPSPPSSQRGPAAPRPNYRSGSSVLREVGPGAGPRANASGGVVAPGVGGGFKAAPPEQQAAAAAALGRTLGVAVKQPPTSAALPGLPVISGAPGAGVKRAHEATATTSTTTSSGSGMTAAPRWGFVNAEGKVVALSGPALAAALQQGRVPAVSGSPAAAAATAAEGDTGEPPPGKKHKVEQQQQQGGLPGLPVFPTPGSPGRQGHVQEGPELGEEGHAEPSHAADGTEHMDVEESEYSGRQVITLPTQWRSSNTRNPQPSASGVLVGSSTVGPHPGLQQQQQGLGQQQQQQQQGVEEISYHQLTVQAVNLAEQPKGGLEAYTLVCDLLDGADPAERQVGADLLRLLKASDPQQLRQVDLASMVEKVEIGGCSSSFLAGLRDMLLALYKLRGTRRVLQQHQMLHDQAVSELQSAVEQLALQFKRGPSARQREVVVCLQGLPDCAAKFVKVSGALPAQGVLAGVAAAVIMATVSALGRTGVDVIGWQPEQTLGRLVRLVKDSQLKLYECTQLWSQLAACLADAGERGQSGSLVCEEFVNLWQFGLTNRCLTHSMLLAQPEYAAGLLRLKIKQRHLRVALAEPQPLRGGGSSSTGLEQGQAPPPSEAAAQVVSLPPEVVQEMELCSSLMERLLGTDNSSGEVQLLAAAYARSSHDDRAALQADVACMLARLQLAEAAVDVLLQLSHADLLAHCQEAAASGTPSAVGLAARVVTATAGEKRLQVVAARVRMPRSNCKRLLGVRRQSEAAAQ